MPVTLKKGHIFYKNNSGTYTGLDVITDKATQQQIDLIQNAKGYIFTQADQFVENLKSSLPENFQTVLENFSSTYIPENHQYTVGDYCTYEGVLYRCTAETNGAFDSADWEAVKVGTEFQNIDAEIDDLKSAINGMMTSIPFGFAIAAGSYWKTDGTDGTTSNSRYARTNSNAIPGYPDKCAVGMSGDVYEFQLVFYDGEGTYIGKTEMGSGIQYISPDAVSYAVNVHRKDNASIASSERATIKGLLNEYYHTQTKIDDTLTEQGKAADAYAVGTRLTTMSTDIDAVETSVGTLSGTVGDLSDTVSELQDGALDVYPKLAEVEFDELTADAAYHNLGYTLVAGVHYKITLKLDGYTDTDIGKITSIATFSSATSSARVDYITTLFGTLKPGVTMVADYTPTANCSYVKIGYGNNYSPETNKSYWRVYDASVNKIDDAYEALSTSLVDNDIVDFSNLSRWEWTIGTGGNFKWNHGNATYNNSYVIPVKGYKEIEIVANAVSSTFYVLMNSAQPTTSAVDSSYGRQSVALKTSAVIDLEKTPANYIYILRIDSNRNDHTPLRLSLRTTHSNPYDQIAALKAEVDALKQLIYGNVSVALVEGNGVEETVYGQRSIATGLHDIPQNQGVRNFIARADYIKDVPWVSVGPIKMKDGTEIEAGTHTGIPYSSVKECCKFVGWNVSFKTFFTAAHNPYSLFYTENVSEENSESGYGFTYHGTNCASYYGIVCSILQMFVYGIDEVYWGSRQWNGYLRQSGYIIQSDDNTATGIRLGDMITERGHASVIVDVVRDTNGVPTKIVLEETYNPQPVLKYLTLEGMNNRINSEKEHICRYPKLSLVPALEPFDAINYVYNDDICTYAGDDAAFYEGEPIWINYTKGSYTSMKLYKDNTLLQTLTLSSDSSLHKLDVSEYCDTYGMYKACLSDGTNDSGYTNWQVVQTDVTCTKGDGYNITVTFSSANATPTHIELCYISGGSKGVYVLSEEEKRAGTVTFDALELLTKEFEYAFSSPDDLSNPGDGFYQTTYARVFFKAEFGTVFNALVDTHLYEE